MTKSKKNDDSSYQSDLPLLSVMNNDIDGIVRWCTPSIHPSVPKVQGIYDSDISISYHALGSPSMNTGVFQKAQDKAAKAYKSDRTLFSVSGTTGSNFIVLRALKKQLGKVKMLAQRNVHKSISVGIEDYRIDTTYLPIKYDDELQVFIPNTIDEIMEALDKNPETNVLLLTLPTYEGLSINLDEAVKRIRAKYPNVIIYIDEAWGAHFPFSDKLPRSAMEAGADICVQSTHKQGSGLQQTSMIHWKCERIGSEYIMASYKALMTTSPSFHLLASLDGARFLMETSGKEIIDDIIDVADALRDGLSTIPTVKAVTINDIRKRHKHIEYADTTKVLVNVEGTGLSGYDIAHYLEDNFKIIVEKYEANNILFLTTFQNRNFEVFKTIENFKQTLKELKTRKKSKKIVMPKFPIEIISNEQSYDADIRTKKKFISIKKALGRECAEIVVPYPPGIPLLTKGEIILQEHIDYLLSLKDFSNYISVIMKDVTLKKILVVSE